MTTIMPMMMTTFSNAPLKRSPEDVVSDSLYGEYLSNEKNWFI